MSLFKGHGIRVEARCPHMIEPKIIEELACAAMGPADGITPQGIVTSGELDDVMSHANRIRPYRCRLNGQNPGFESRSSTCKFFKSSLAPEPGEQLLSRAQGSKSPFRESMQSGFMKGVVRNYLIARTTSAACFAFWSGVSPAVSSTASLKERV
jgi:hypothetical protein